MRGLLVFPVHFLTTLARLLGPGGTRAVIAETLVIKLTMTLAVGLNWAPVAQGGPGDPPGIGAVAR